MEVEAGFKLTEMGPIPLNWDVRAIREIGQVKGGKRLPKGSFLVDTDTGHPYVRVSDMIEGGVLLTDLQFVPKEIFPSIRQYTISSKDIIISVAGTLGIVGIVPPELEGANLTENADKITDILCDRDYLFYSLTSDRIKRHIENAQTKGAQPKLAIARIQEFRVAIPVQPSEQRAIAGVLSDVDSLLASLDRLIAKQRALKQAAMQQLLTGETRLPGFATPWQPIKLAETLRVRHGKSQWQVISNEGQYPILGSGGKIGTANDYLYDRPSVLIGRKGTIDAPQYIEKPFWTIDTLFYTEIGDSASPKFIYYLFQTIDWRSYNEASGVPSLNASTIEAIEVTCPEHNEQRAIAGVLSDMDAEIAALEARRRKTHALKQALMQELLTGRIRLPLAGEPEGIA